MNPIGSHSFGTRRRGRGENARKRAPFRRNLPFGILALALTFGFGCTTDSPSSGPKGASSGSGASSAALWTDRTEEWGLAFHHANGMSGERYFCEMVGPGGALFDADGDGDLDLFITQGAPLDRPISETILAPPPEQPPGDRLFLNRLNEGERRFTPSPQSFPAEDYGMGATVGDVDGDGDLDLFVTNFGTDRLFRNDGRGNFEDVTAAAGLPLDDVWTTSAVFFDPDRDGDLDLFVCAYVDFSLENHKPCYSETSAIDYCGPSSFRPLADRFYRNRGDGTFEDATASSRLGSEEGAALGVVAADFDGDGWLDLYVANDGTPNRLWKNQGDGTFVDTGLLSGCAYNRDGRAEASMGVEAEDFDNDGDLDLFLTHLTDETNTLYRNDGGGLFEDGSASSGLGVPSRAFTGFGTAALDLDLDGWLDLFIGNGAVKTIEALAAAGNPFPLHQRNQFFRNRGDGTFSELTPEENPILRPEEVTRGVAMGDLDNDGGLDLILLNNAGPAEVLIAPTPPKDRWIGFDIRRSDDAAPAVGARVRVTRSDGQVLERRVRIASSYLCGQDARVIFGLGETEVSAVEIIWPNGSQTKITGSLEAGRYHSLRHTGEKR